MPDSRGGDRIQSLDILRGLALLGMFIVHFHQRSSEPGGVDDLVRTAVWRLVESKSHGTFALLFGAGFAIMLRRADAAGRPFVAFYLRRLAVLALFGFAAHLLFGFNVLLGYALWGVPLLLIRRVPTWGLVALAALCTISSPVYHLLNEQRLLRAGGVAAISPSCTTWLPMWTPNSSRKRRQTAATATRAVVSRADARSRMSRASCRSYLRRPVRSA